MLDYDINQVPEWNMVRQMIYAVAGSLEYVNKQINTIKGGCIWIEKDTGIS